MTPSWCPTCGSPEITWSEHPGGIVYWYCHHCGANAKEKLMPEPQPTLLPAKQGLLRKLNHVEKRAVRSFLYDAYYQHEISPGDFDFLLDKLDKA